MIEVSACVICDAPIRRVKNALVAPFVAQRIWNRKPFAVDLVGCDSCGFMFYNPRLDDSDLRSLYSNAVSAFMIAPQNSSPCGSPGASNE
jgi:hypothetical protein